MEQHGCTGASTQTASQVRASPIFSAQAIVPRRRSVQVSETVQAGSLLTVGGLGASQLSPTIVWVTTSPVVSRICCRTTGTARARHG